MIEKYFIFSSVQVSLTTHNSEETVFNILFLRHGNAKLTHIENKSFCSGGFSRRSTFGHRANQNPNL